MPINIGLIVINIAASYLLGRLTAPNGPRLKDRQATGGDYGIPMPRGYGEKVRVDGAFIAQADIRERKHKTGGGLLEVLSLGLISLLGPKYYTYSDTFALFLLDRTDDDPIEGIEKLWANGKLIFNVSEATVVDEEIDGDGHLVWRKYGKNKYLKSLTLYAGHSDHPVDPILDAVVDEFTGYPYSAYVVLEDLQLADFGNSIPACSILLNVKEGETLASAAESICAAANISVTHDISTTALIDNVVRGCLINDESSCWAALKPLLPVYSKDCAEVAGQLRFYERTQSLRATIPTEDMGSYVYGDSPPALFNFSRNPDLNLPKSTTINFIDPDRDYQPNTSKPAERAEGSAASNVSLNLPLVMTADEAATAAEVMHWDAWLGRTSATFTLTDAWHSISPGLAYAIPVAGQYVPYRVISKTRGANGITEIEAHSDESVVYTASATGDSGVIPEEPSTLFADTRLVLIDGPILDDSHDDYGYYVAMAGTEEGWTRAQVDLSTDAGATYDLLFDSDGSTIIGDVTGTLAAGTTTGLDDTLDTTSTLTVVLEHEGMLLESATDAELDEGVNMAFVGEDGLGEYLQFKTATFVSGTTWQLTNLRRGRKGTDWAIATHTSGEEFVLLEGEGIFRVKSALADWGDALKFRGVTLHQDEADALEVDFTNTGEGKRPYSPINVEGTWDGSNNLTITWDSRSRLNAGGLGIDDNAEWDIEITSGSGRSDTVVAETFSYSAADQITDGIVPGDSIAGRVRQTSDVNDGRWRNFLLLGPDDTWELEDDLTSIHLEDGATPLALEA